MASDDTKHLIGDSVDNRDRLGSPVLLGLAIAGAIVAVAVLALVG